MGLAIKDINLQALSFLCEVSCCETHLFIRLSVHPSIHDPSIHLSTQHSRSLLIQERRQRKWLLASHLHSLCTPTLSSLARLQILNCLDPQPGITQPHHPGAWMDSCLLQFPEGRSKAILTSGHPGMGRL